MELSEEGKKTIDEWNKWNAELNKAVANIGKCLDGFTVKDANEILDRSKRWIQDSVIVRASGDRGIDETH